MIDTNKNAVARPVNVAETAIVVVLALLGLCAIISGFGFGVGTLARMGPGFFPAMLGFGLVGLAIALFFEQRHSAQAVLSMPWRPLFYIFAGLGFWAGAVRVLGLAPATFGLIVIASFAERPFRPVTSLVMAAVLSIGGVLLFIYGFRLPMKAVNW